MKTLILLVIFLISTTAAQAVDSSYIQQKRQDAEQQRDEFMQEIQAKQSNPDMLMQSLNQKATPQTASFKSGAGGHYFVPANINGKGPINFIADTGATSILLTKNDAKLAGIDTSTLNYNKVYNTANGQLKGAETTAKTIKVGPITLSDIPVTISSQQSGQSLLGMTFFSRLSHYEVKNSTMTLYR